MPATRSRFSRLSPELAWGAFAAVNAAVMLRWHDWQTVPFHLIWVSLTILYGFRTWRAWPTAVVSVVVSVITGYALALPVINAGGEGIDELTEIPLMASMFFAMVWHARRREAALREMRAVSDRQRDFVRDASHLLRTPITVARGHAELIATTARGQTAEDAGVVIDELQRLSRLSDRLLVLAAAEDPQFTSVRPVTLRSLLAGTARRWSTAAGRNLHVDEDARGSVCVDAERLVYALDALIENAIKATSPGDRIEVRARVDDDTAVLEVIDTGVGIEPEAVPRVFERFARTAHPDGGTGLGLPIVKAIVEAHGGTIEVDSVPGEGTTMRLRLPATPEPATAPAALPA